MGAAHRGDRISRHLAQVIVSAIESGDGEERVEKAIEFAEAIVRTLVDAGVDQDVLNDIPLDPPRILRAIRERNPDGSVRSIEAPRTPLLDTTVLTNAHGEPKVGHELRAETASADAIDVVMAFIRWSGVRPLAEAIRRHCSEGKPFRVLTTVYTNSTERRALDELRAAGVQIKISYDTSQTRLHAKAWVFHRGSGYSTAYIGSSNLTHSAQVSGFEWNVRLSGARNPDAVQKMVAVFESQARFMAQQFSDVGVQAVAVSGDSPAEERRAALDGLRDGTIQVVFSVDLFNEGVDLRDVDTLLSCGQPTAHCCSYGNSVAVCVRRRGRSAPFSTSSATTGRSSASTGASGR